MKPTLVTGANGHVGNNVCRLLVARGERVRAMIRASADPAPLAGLDAEIVRVVDRGFVTERRRQALHLKVASS